MINWANLLKKHIKDAENEVYTEEGFEQAIDEICLNFAKGNNVRDYKSIKMRNEK